MSFSASFDGKVTVGNLEYNVISTVKNPSQFIRESLNSNKSRLRQNYISTKPKLSQPRNSNKAQTISQKSYLAVGLDSHHTFEP